MIDVGTGLSVLVQGHDFSLLYDAGSKDPAEKPDRVLSYLFATLGPSGDAACVPEGDDWAVPNEERVIDHIVLSHPHSDHGSALPRVLSCYSATHVWDVGKINDAAFYKRFLEAVRDEPEVTYHTVLGPTQSRAFAFAKAKGKVKLPSDMAWIAFEELEVTTLGTGASFTVLNAKTTASDPNANSIVLLVQLGEVRLLLTGDSVSGARLHPRKATGKTEKWLIERHADLIDADILQVGHHGSKTSSRKAFIEAVSPDYAIISSGPTRYSGVKLPDRVVKNALLAAGAKLLETYLNDRKCPEQDHVGSDDKGRGGCDNYVISISSKN